MSRFVASLSLALLVTGCPRAKRELPADPPGMDRIESAKLSIPKPDGYEQVTTGAESVDGVTTRGGIALVRSRQGQAPTTIVVDPGQTAVSRWSRRDCEKVSQRVAEQRSASVRSHDVASLPTGEACHFVTEGGDGRPTEFYYVAGKPPYIVACLGEASHLAAQCRYVASWIRSKP